MQSRNLFGGETDPHACPTDLVYCSSALKTSREDPYPADGTSASSLCDEGPEPRKQTNTGAVHMAMENVYLVPPPSHLLKQG